MVVGATSPRINLYYNVNAIVLIKVPTNGSYGFLSLGLLPVILILIRIGPIKYDTTPQLIIIIIIVITSVVVFEKEQNVINQRKKNMLRKSRKKGTAR